MRGFFAILLVVLLVTVGVAVWIFSTSAPADVAIRPVSAGSTGNSWVQAYASYARTPLFSAFITLGSFLLTLKTTMLQRLKDAYDSENYKDTYLAHKASNPHARYYGHLERLSTALATSIGLAFFTSLLQLTLGFSRSPIAVGICAGFGVTTVLVVFFLAAQMFLAHREWFDKIESEKQKLLEAQKPKEGG